VQHQAFKTFSNLEQSMFKRFVRLNVPRVLLDRQGRCRPELASLFNWRYSSNGISLQNLPVIHQNPRYLLANPGFLYTYQFINVPDFEGKGERAPSPHFYQNVGEAEYVVALYQFMRLIGYPAEKISILATYNGQKQLIQDIIAKRCRNPIFGRPASVTTVDKYQGQQNDFILLSLVRTESVGHIRDIRRLIVALSRARLGLYIFGRRSLYQNCFEISNALSYVLNGPAELSLVRDENYSAVHRPLSSHVAPELIVPIADVTALGVLVYQMTQNYQLFQQQQSSLQLQQTDALQTSDANSNTIKSSMDIDENDSV
jgi:intron-binding protein aquarius